MGGHAADVGDIFLILGVDRAERVRQRQPVADGGDVLAEPRAAFEFESLEARLAGVRHDAAEGRRAGDGARDRTRNLDVAIIGVERSEEHTSELQSLMRSSYAVFCLKKQK